jgi:uncharacterized protein
MTPQESQMLQEFLTQLTQAKGIAKDSEADTLIRAAMSQQPDAGYLLVQRSLLQSQALINAQAQIAQLKSELQAGKSGAGSSFLDSGSAWGRPAADTPRPPQAAPAAGPAPATTVKPGFLSGGAGGMLGTIAATAAGVAGGAFLFQGIENLMGHHGMGSGLLGHEETPRIAAETAINNDASSDDAATDDTSFDADTDNADDSSGDDDSMSV